MAPTRADDQPTCVMDADLGRGAAPAETAQSRQRLERAIRMALAERIETIRLLRTLLPRLHACNRGEATLGSRLLIEELARAYRLPAWSFEPCVNALMLLLAERDQPQLRWLQYPSVLSTEMAEGWAADLDARGARPHYGDVELWTGAREAARAGIFVTPPRPSQIDQIAAVQAATRAHAGASQEAALDRLAAWYGELALRAGVPSALLGPSDVWCARGLRRELRTWALSALEPRPSHDDRSEVDRLLPTLDADIPAGLVYVRTADERGSADLSRVTE